MREDTINLLKECNSGIKMGIDALDDVLPKAKAEDLKNILRKSKEKHEEIKKDTRKILNEDGLSGEKPSGMAEIMSKMKTSFMLAVKDEDTQIASLITDGCNMGIKSLNKYLNEYSSADENVKDLVKHLIIVEEDLQDDLKKYL